MYFNISYFIITVNFRVFPLTSKTLKVQKLSRRYVEMTSTFMITVEPQWPPSGYWEVAALRLASHRGLS